MSNPPYIAATDAHFNRAIFLQNDGALVAGHTGLEAIQHIVERTPHYLEPGGWLLLEHGFDQADAVARCLLDRGFQHIETRQDWSGHARMTGGQWLD